MKRIFAVDIALIPAFLASAVSGVALHAAGHGEAFGVRQCWVAAHVILVAVFSVLVASHVNAHKGWYKGLFKNGLGSKSRITLLLSTLFVCVSVSGLASLFAGDASHVGMWHYAAGLVMSAAVLIHLSGRLRRLIAAVRK